MMKAPPRRPDPMPTRRTIILVAAFPVAAFGAGSTALALSLGATAADAIGTRFRDRHLQRLQWQRRQGPPARRRTRHPALFRAVARSTDGQGPEDRRQTWRGRLARLRSVHRRSGLGDYHIDIAVDDGAPGKATATVKFTNFDKAATVRLDLVKIKNDWRIADITWLRDGKADSLRKIYSR
jgi:hypothetical protein